MPELLSKYSPPIFVLGFHRGGTTLVQRLLNCHEEVTIWGENAGIISDFRRMYTRFADSPVGSVDVQKYREFSKYANTFNPWANPFDKDDLVTHIAHMLELLYADPSGSRSFWGFKEVRNGNIEDIGFLRRLFPDCRLVMVIRHPKDLLLSQYYARWGGKHFSEPPDETVRNLVTDYAETIEAYLETVEKNPSVSRILRYESIRMETVMTTLFGFLGLSRVGINKGLLGVVLKTRAGSSYGDVSRPVDCNYEQQIRRACDELIEPTLDRVATPRTLEAVRSWYPMPSEEA